MRYDNREIGTFFSLVRAGLFPVHGEGSMDHGSSQDVDWEDVYRLAEEQSVIGLVASGIEAIQGEWLKVNGSPMVPQAVALQFIGRTLQIEQRNKAMNAFVAELIDGLRKADVYTLVVKGQGIAQCYEKPLWRSCGDVDLLLSKDNYDQAKAFLQSKANHIDAEDERRQHLGMTIDGWIVELHGTLLTGISNRLNKVISQVQDAIFLSGEVRSWMVHGERLMIDGSSRDVQVFLPSPDNDVFLVFSHILEHFYVGGIGLRQICDWCRLLWTYRESLNHGLLESRLHEAGIMTEWKGFAAFAVDYLGMPFGAMPFYENKQKWHKKADRLCTMILKTGNFGHNKDESYRGRTSKIKELMITFGRRIAEYWKLMRIFPTQVPGIFVTYVTGRVKANV